jgi:hypothetical protein
MRLSDLQAAFVCVIGGPLLASFGLLISDAYWDRWYGSSGKNGRLYAPILRRLPRSLGRGFFVLIGVLMTLGGLVLFLNGS